MSFGGTTMKFIKIMKIIISLMPILVDAIKAAEEALPGNGKGEQKLAMIRGILEAGYSMATDAEASFDEIWPAIIKAVGSIVTAFNAAGVFKK
jgi:hypothetical protein